MRETDIQFNDPAALVVIVCNDKMFTELGPHQKETSSMPCSKARVRTEPR